MNIKKGSHFGLCAPPRPRPAAQTVLERANRPLSFYQPLSHAGRSRRHGDVVDRWERTEVVSSPVDKEGGLLGALLEWAPQVFECQLLPQLCNQGSSVELAMLAQCSRGLREAVIPSGLPRPVRHLVEDYVASVERLSWARRNGCPWVAATTALVARRGSLEVLQWARANHIPCDFETLAQSRIYGHRATIWRWAKE